MKFAIKYPMNAGLDPRFLQPETMVRFAQAAERAGYDAIAFTEHPAPSQKWLSSGGHESFDPLTALAFVAAATERLRLHTYLLVLPYRNPFLAAKQASTVDVLSGGRLTLALGTGYLRSEFAALGVDFTERNALFDESVDVMTGIWQTPDFAYEGRHFTARGQTQRPVPVQTPHPPLWIGGNSQASRRRVATVGQGWAPLLINEQMSQTTRTPPLSSPQALAAAVAELRESTAAQGRDPAALDIHVEWHEVSEPAGATSESGRSVEEVRDKLGQLAEAGATWSAVEPANDDAERAIDSLTAYAESVIQPGR